MSLCEAEAAAVLAALAETKDKRHLLKQLFQLWGFETSMGRLKTSIPERLGVWTNFAPQTRHVAEFAMMSYGHAVKVHCAEPVYEAPSRRSRDTC